MFKSSFIVRQRFAHTFALSTSLSDPREIKIALYEFGKPYLAFSNIQWAWIKIANVFSQRSCGFILVKIEKQIMLDMLFWYFILNYTKNSNTWLFRSIHDTIISRSLWHPFQVCNKPNHNKISTCAETILLSSPPNRIINSKESQLKINW